MKSKKSEIRFQLLDSAQAKDWSSEMSQSPSKRIGLIRCDKVVIIKRGKY